MTNEELNKIIKDCDKEIKEHKEAAKVSETVALIFGGMILFVILFYIFFQKTFIEILKSL
jgi:uncharacterized membrane protein